MIVYYNLLKDAVDEYNKRIDKIIEEVQSEVEGFCRKYNITFTNDEEFGFHFHADVDLNNSIYEEIERIYGNKFAIEYNRILTIIETSIPLPFFEFISDGLKNYDK